MAAEGPGRAPTDAPRDPPAPRRGNVGKTIAMVPLRPLVGTLRGLARREEGVVTANCLFLVMASCMVGAAAVDVTHFYAAQAQLQVAADLAGHAALLTRNRGRTAEEARAEAVAAVAFGMPAADYGEVIDDADILFGRFDPGADVFEVDAASRAAVLVTTGRETATRNPVPSFLFRIIGVRSMDVATQAVFTTHRPPCLSEGLVAEEVVDIQSQNTFLRGFCAHANGHVELNQGNLFGTGTKVSMPQLEDLVMPRSGLAGNDGLEAALTEGSYDLRVLDRLRPGFPLPEGVVPFDTAISTLGTEETPWFLGAGAAVELAPGTLGPASFTRGRVHRVSCAGGASRTVSSTGRGGGGGGGSGGGGGGSPTLKLGGGTYAEIVLLTDCPIQFDGDVLLQDAILSTTDTSADSIKTPSGAVNGLQIGRDDGCAPGGGATILTRGGVRAAAKLALYGGQIRALGDVDFQAQAVGEGVSVISGGRIDANSRIEMSGCGEGMDPNFELPLFALAR